MKVLVENSCVSCENYPQYLNQADEYRDIEEQVAATTEFSVVQEGVLGCRGLAQNLGTEAQEWGVPRPARCQAALSPPIIEHVPLFTSIKGNVSVTVKYEVSEFPGLDPHVSGQYGVEQS